MKILTTLTSLTLDFVVSWCRSWETNILHILEKFAVLMEKYFCGGV